DNTMGGILEFIQQEGKGKYLCYKTQKMSLDTNTNDILSYDDKSSIQMYGSKFAESNQKRVPTVDISQRIINTIQTPIFSFFLDGSRHIYKVDDIAIGNHIFPFLAGQIIVGCCERRNRDIFKKAELRHKLVLSLPSDFNVDDDENYCRLFLEKINAHISQLPFISNSGIHFDDILLYETDGMDKNEKGKNGLINRGTARIQTVMTDEEQYLVSYLCKHNRLDDEHWLIKDGSLEYTPSERLKDEEWLKMRNNYKYVVGVSKQFNPDLISDFEKNRLSKTIASLKPFQRTKVYRYHTDQCQVDFAIWYLRLRNSNFRETHFSDVVKCEMILPPERDFIESEEIDIICANLIREAYPVCYGSDTRWANHIYPVFLTEKFCKSNYIDNNIILKLF
ncbi:MAG: hypothetical protein LUC88_02320, partial [Prevotella sp.]|nr:hypothetical protein [Prevotella sp.]